MNPEAVAWLNQFRGLHLDDRQRLALVYLRHHAALTNSEYRKLNHVDALMAGQELRGLVQTGLVEQKGAGRWTYYSLKISKGAPLEAKTETDEDKILAHVREHGSINNTECRELLDVDDTRAYYLLTKLAKIKKIRPKGRGKGRRYVLS